MRYRDHANEEQCPRCGGDDTFIRVQRSQFVRRFFPHTKQMRCDACNAQYLVQHRGRLQIAVRCFGSLRCPPPDHSKIHRDSSKRSPLTVLCCGPLRIRYEEH
jgi:hypothetical protein